MDRYRVLIGINIILLSSLIGCILFLTKKPPKKDPVKEIVIELLDNMIRETHDDFFEHFKYYEMSNFVISKKIDSFYVLTNQENIFYSSQLMNYYDKIASRDSIETKVIFNTISSIKNKQSQDFILMSKLMEYRFIKKVIEHSGYLSFFWLEGLGINMFSKKDTIQMGEEYIAEFSYTGVIFNKEQKPIVVLDGDTLDADLGYCKFNEKPQKRGLVKHEGYMTYFHSGGISKFPIKFEYYVK